MHREVERYYIDQAQAYFDRTRALDSSFFLRPFVERLPEGARVLDLGCGSGRDLLFLKSLGFEALGVERSPALARLARDHSGCPVICGDYQTLDLSDARAAGLVFSASLVHLPHGRVEPALKHLLPALVPGGHVYISLKQGCGVHVDDHRRMFYLWEDGYARMLFDVLGLAAVDARQTDSLDQNDVIWLSYCLKYEPDHQMV
ncbi:class I SAM-dependent methyltransferase [Desulfatiferula olefinivorans]